MQVAFGAKPAQELLQLSMSWLNSGLLVVLDTVHVWPVFFESLNLKSLLISSLFNSEIYTWDGANRIKGQADLANSQSRSGRWRPGQRESSPRAGTASQPALG